VDVTPNTIKRSVDDGPVQATFTIPFQTVAAVEPSSVRISQIGGIDVNFLASSVTVSGTGSTATATFDRAAVNSFLQANAADKKAVAFVVSGSGTGGWTFEGTDTVSTK
jgi:hypothetical protein